MSGCSRLLQLSPKDTRCTGLPILLCGPRRDTSGLAALKVPSGCGEVAQEPVCTRKHPALPVRKCRRLTPGVDRFDYRAPAPASVAWVTSTGLVKSW